MKLTAAVLTAGLLVAYASAAAVPASEAEVAHFSNRIILIRHAEKGFATLPGDHEGEKEPTHLHKHGEEQHRPTPGSGKKPAEHDHEHYPPPPPGGHWPGRGHERGPGSDRPPPEGPGRKFPSGLSDKGIQRAEYLRTLFGNESDYDFGLIFAPPREPTEKEGERTYATVAPLAKDLGLTIDIDCANEPHSCVAEHVREFARTSDVDILICWKHRELHNIATALGAPNAKTHYPDERNDVIWIMEGGEISEKRSMHMPGLDDGRVDEGDPDLEVEEAGKSIAEYVYGIVGSLFLRGEVDR